MLRMKIDIPSTRLTRPLRHLDDPRDTYAVDDSGIGVAGVEGDQLSGEPRDWKRLTQRVFLDGWHTNAAFDTRQQALIVFGNKTNSNDIAT